MSPSAPSAPELHDRRLATYLNDRLAVATAGAELARRALSSNRGTPYEPALEAVAAALESDEQLLREVMAALGARVDRVKLGAAWLGEKLGRLKPNDALVRYSPLSRVVELDALAALLRTLEGTWTALEGLLGTDPRVPDLSGARERVQAGLARLEPLRAPAAADALTRATGQ